MRRRVWPRDARLGAVYELRGRAVEVVHLVAVRRRFRFTRYLVVVTYLTGPPRTDVVRLGELYDAGNPGRYRAEVTGPVFAETFEAHRVRPA